MNSSHLVLRQDVCFLLSDDNTGVERENDLEPQYTKNYDPATFKSFLHQSYGNEATGSEQSYGSYNGFQSTGIAAGAQPASDASPVGYPPEDGAKKSLVTKQNLPYHEPHPGKLCDLNVTVNDLKIRTGSSICRSEMKSLAVILKGPIQTLDSSNNRMLDLILIQDQWSLYIVVFSVTFQPSNYSNYNVLYLG